MIFKEYASRCGRLLLGVRGQALCLCDWIVDGRIEKTVSKLKKYLQEGEEDDDKFLLEKVAEELNEYFSGKRKEFDVPLLLAGTEFQRKVWNTLSEVKYGETFTYKDLAKSIGHPASVRAVANAVGANPASIFIPCHRIVGSDGSLTGYAGGLEAKSFLLQLEQQFIL